VGAGMSDAWEMAPPPFDADSALQTMKRFARDQRVLVERGEGWMLGADVVLKLTVDGTTVKVQLTKRPARTPEWDTFTLKSATELRKLQDEIKRRLTRWKDEE
jgi:hypothetical protein